MTATVGAIYKWLDEKGRIQFSDKHPAEGKVESLSIAQQRSRSLKGRIVDGQYRTWDGTI